MNESLYIEKNKVLPQALDYEYLRKKGLEYIQKLSRDLWTDYNAHDPGITQLEVLCYALTELSYRCHFPIENLITGESGRIENTTFFTPKKILTNAPLTVLDYRKKLIDIEGITNAWVVYQEGRQGRKEPLPNEVPIFIDELADGLSFDSQNKKGENLLQLYPRGLNKVYIDIAESPQLGLMNEVSIDFSVYHNASFLEAKIITEFSDWNDPRSEWFKNLNSPSKIKFLNTSNSIDEFSFELEVEHSSNPQKHLKFMVRTKHDDELEEIRQFLELEKNFCDFVTKPFSKKNQEIKRIYKEVHSVLHSHRNLCEDWLCIETISKTKIGICTQIDFEPNADIAATLSKVYIALQEVIHPKLRFYTLQEMLKKGLPTEEIFQGPSLSHGFLIDEEVKNSDLPDCIHASDCISAMMNIQGIKSVKEFLFTAYDENGKVIENAKNQKWCIHLEGKTQPILDLELSKLRLYKEGIPFSLSEQNQQELSLHFSYQLGANNTKIKDENLATDFELPHGEYLSLNEYLSIQHEFPVTYKIGKNEMPKNASPERKAQAKQLKAYLLHFDQLLSDFFNQLYHAKNLLDLNPDENKEPYRRTYFPRELQDIPGVETSNFYDEYAQANFSNTLLPNSLDEKGSLYETEAEFYERRNRFLDHLIARFSISFSEYASMMFMIQQNAKGVVELTFQQQELINDKERFITELPELGARRAVGFNYLQLPTQSDLFDEYIQNELSISGFQKRISRLLGINNITLSDLAKFGDTPQNTWHYDTPTATLPFRMLSDSDLSLPDKWETVHRLIHDVSAYTIRKTNTGYWIDIVNEDGKRIAKYEHKFANYDEASQFIPKLYQDINSTLENMYCIEHLLLRPLFSIHSSDSHERNEHLLQVCLKDSCNTLANQDPYSFKVTVILRGDLARFRNPYFREYAEKIIRSEAPAHILIKICWVSKEEILLFQKAYKDWIQKYRKVKSQICNSVSDSLRNQYNTSLKNLIEALTELNTIYDKGTLYNCQLSDSENPIVLSKTSLGTL